MKELFSKTEFQIEPITPEHLDEIQTADSEKLVRDKTLKAFANIQKPLFVEHTYLKINVINGFPGGLTSSFWETLGGKLICKYFSKSRVTAETIICFCNAKNISTFRGHIDGTISSKPQGKSEFQWDTIFIPKSFKKTFAQMTSKQKNEISMRKKAVEDFIKHLEKIYE